MEAKKWVDEERSVELLEICGERCKSEVFKRTICDLAITTFRTELHKFLATKKIYQPTMTITPEPLTTFSLHTLSETMTTRYSCAIAITPISAIVRDTEFQSR